MKPGVGRPYHNQVNILFRKAETYDLQAIHDCKRMRLAYLDFGGKGPSLLALHGHFSCAGTFSDLAEALHRKWRVVALDQRGDGWSDKPEDYSQEVYIGDLVAAIDGLGLAPTIILGH